MQEAYLEVTYRHGRALAAYYYLPRHGGERARRTERLFSGLLVDYGDAGRPVGIEITAPARISLEEFNRALATLGIQPVTSADIAPLHAA